jgi:hypothetical protein
VRGPLCRIQTVSKRAFIRDHRAPGLSDTRRRGPKGCQARSPDLSLANKAPRLLI